MHPGADGTVRVAVGGEVGLVVRNAPAQDAEAGARLGRVVAEATSLGRDLANAPGSSASSDKAGIAGLPKRR